MTKERILIVEDEILVAQSLNQILVRLGYEVVGITTSGEDAIKYSHQFNPDLILMDILLNGELDGIQTAQEIHSYIKIPIIYLTALSDQETLQRAKVSDPFGYLVKPFNERELHAAIEMGLYRHKTEAKLQKHQEILEEKVVERTSQLQKANTQLRDINLSKDKFFSIISHDLKSPFTSLLSLSETLLLDFDDIGKEDIKGFLFHLNRSARHLYRLLENLLQWSTLQTDGMSFEPAKINLENLVIETIGIFSEMANRKKIKLNWEIAEDEYVFADENMLNSTLHNLISNALKFTKPDGKVIISSKKMDDYIEVSVSDDGVGISEENQKKLFRIDINYSTLGTNSETGSGLGLIICEEFVKRNNGVLKVESEIGKGSVFTFTVPMCLS